MKKAAKWLNLAAFVVAYGGLAALERFPLKPMKYSFREQYLAFSPPLVPPTLICLKYIDKYAQP